MSDTVAYLMEAERSQVPGIIMKELVTYVATALADHPEEVKVREYERMNTGHGRAVACRRTTWAG